MNNYEEDIREIAEYLYKLCNDYHNYEVRAIWEDDTWNVNTNNPLQNGIKNVYYNKALKIYYHFEDVNEIKKVCNFLYDNRVLKELVDKI